MMVMTTMMVMTAAKRLRQILHVGKLAVLRRARKIAGKLVQLISCCGISIRLRRLRGALQIRSDLLGHLLVLSRVGSLKLLERTHHLDERRQLPVVGL